MTTIAQMARMDERQTILDTLPKDRAAGQSADWNAGYDAAIVAIIRAAVMRSTRIRAIPQDGSAAEEARTRQWREVGLGAQILKDLGVRSIRVLSSSQHTYVGLGGFGIEITGTEGLEG